MANWYVNSAATGTNAGTSWTNACTSLANLLALGSPPVAGDSIFIASTSAESYSTTTTLTFPGTPASPNNIYSVDTTNTPPLAADLLAGASVTMTSTASLTVAGSYSCYGVNFIAPANTGMNLGSTSSQQKFDTCQFTQPGNATSFCASDSYCLLTNCKFAFNSGNAQIRMIGTGRFDWKNSLSAISGATLPTDLFSNLQQGQIFLEGVDLSALGSGKTIFNSASADQCHIKDCKINASVTIAAQPTGGGRTYVSRTDSSGTDNVFQLYDYAGTEINNTSVNRTGGSQDFSGNAFSKKIVTTANAKIAPFPFESLPIAVVNTLVGSTRTVTLYGVWDSPYGANVPPNTADIWCEVEYPGSSSSPIGSYAYPSGVTVPINPLNTPSGAYTQDVTSVWNGTSGFTHAVAWTMVVTLTAQIAGPLTIRVYCAKPSTTFYVDAAPSLT